jgi:type IV pilus assembly protein PilV
MEPGTSGRRARHGAGSRARGFSLVEVLISIIILSIGLLGMVALQAAALQGNRSARVQSVAVTLARELADMLRGNKDVAILRTDITNPYLGDFSAKPLVPRTTSNCLNPGNSCPFNPLTPLPGQTEVAAAQMTDWLARVDEALPGARVVVCFDDSPFDASTGLPRWGCTPSTNATMMIKFGWTQGSTDRSGNSATPLERATGALSRPSLVLPVTPGNEK